MPSTLSLRDETATGQTLHQWSLEFLTERISVRELIRSRVYQEVQDYQQCNLDVFRGLITPKDSERKSNGDNVLKRTEIDWKAQFERACAAFDTSQVLILVNEKQAETLDEEIVIKSDTRVAFIKLVPLVGG